MPEVPKQLVVLTRENYGVNPVPLTEQYVAVKAPDGQQVHLKTATWKRQESPMQEEIAVRDALPHQQKNQAVFLSGFGTRSEDLPVAFEGLGQFWETVVGLDHPDAPTSTITPHDRPLNKEDFYNSGYIILRTIEAKIKDGTLKEGVVAVGLSTGAPVLLEAVAQDIRESADTDRPRYIESLLLLAPAGLLERASFNEIAAGAGSAMGPYLKENYLRDLYLRVFGKFKSDTAVGVELKTRTKFMELCQRIKTAWNKPEWKDIRGMHIGFELFEYAAQRMPVDEFMAFFHRIWPNQDPHFLPMTPSIVRNQELVYRNVTQKAREAIHDTNIFIELYENDKAVPPDGFLTVQDKHEIDRVTLNDVDQEELARINDKRGVARKENNKKRRDAGGKELPALEPYSEAWMLENKKEEMLLDGIIQRVKELFPNNGDNTHIAINVGGNHITPKIDLDMIADLTVRRMDIKKNPQ